jgi:hypothetical protein
MSGVARRAAAIAIVSAQLVLIVRAYLAPIDTFGFQMFPESSQWEADIFRVLADGSRIDVREPWPGDYRWEAMVDARGLGAASARHHADAGLAATLRLLDAALDWVAANTPDDHETVRLVAVVTLVDNGRSPTEVVLESVSRR